MCVKRESNCKEFIANWPILEHYGLLNPIYAFEMRKFNNLLTLRLTKSQIQLKTPLREKCLKQKLFN